MSEISANAPASILSVAQMYRADEAAIASGLTGAVLMENAGAAVERAIRRRWSPRPTIVLCGPGNNGGDGFVVARRLSDRGWPVSVALLGERDALKGDAATMAGWWRGPVGSLGLECLDGQVLVVDALFGAGLSRPVDGPARACLSRAAERTLEIVSIDVPSGVQGDTGAVLGYAPSATATVTFFRPKPGHFLFPGRELRGALTISDIGIPASVADEIGVETWLNEPSLWAASLPAPVAETHKYRRGHVLVIGGGRETTGAARMVARAALRAGAGLVTVAAPQDALGIYAGGLTAVMTKPIADDNSRDDHAYESLLDDARFNTVAIGPGVGVNDTTRARVMAALEADKACVLDADGLTSFSRKPSELFDVIKKNKNKKIVMTPHDGEFKRLFDVAGDRLSRAREGARVSGAIVLLKGADTVVAAPNGHATITAHAPPDLATAGAGDVLTGLIAAFLGQGLDAFSAASMAAWVHADAASRFGAGLIAEDLPEIVPAVMSTLRRLSAGIA